MKKIASIFFILLALIIFSVSASYAAISVVQAGSLHPGNSLAFTNNVTTGNLIVVVAQYDTVDPSASATDTRGNTYTLIAKAVNSYTIQYMWYAKNVTGGADTVTVTSGADNALSIIEISGADTTAPLDVYNTYTSSSNTAHPTITLTPTVSDTIIVAIFGKERGAGSFTPDSGWTEDTDVPTNAHTLIHQVFSTSGSKTAGTTQLANTVWAGIAASFTIAGTQGSGSGSGSGGTTYYVDVNSLGGPCSNSNPGTSITAPWCSMERATDWQGTASSGVTAGATVYVRGGTYAVTRPRSNDDNAWPALNPSNSGISGNPVTFKNYNTETVTITYSGSEIHQGPIIGANSRDYIVWDGFIIQEVAANNMSDTGPVVLDSSDFVTIQNCDIRGVPDTPGDNHNGIRIDYSDYAVIKNNKVHGIRDGQNGHNHAEIMLYDSDHILIEHNEIYDSGAGIFPKGGDHTAGGDPDNRDIIIRYNLIHDNDVVGIRTSFTADAKIYQNIFYNNVWDFEFGESCFTSDCSGNMDIKTPANIDVYNNTMYGSSRAIYFAKPDVTRIIQTGNDIRNNLISNETYPMTTESSELPKYASDYNYFYSYTSLRYGGGLDYDISQWRSTTGYDTHSIIGNPLFVNPANHDFHLQAGSLVRNAGIDFVDLNGNGLMTDTITIGAYITGNEIIGPTTDLMPPGPPPNLR